MNPAKEEYITFNGVKTFIRYNHLTSVIGDEMQKDPKKIPFIIQHGHSANRFFVKPIFDYFEAKNLPVISFDWRGHGWTQKGLEGQYTLDNCVQDLRAVYEDFLVKRFGYQQFYLLGHSMGGFLALKYALKYPKSLNKLVLIATSACINTNPIVKLGMRFLINRYKNNYESWFYQKKKAHIKLGIEFFPQWNDPSLMPDPVAVYEFLKDMIHYDIRSQLPNIQIPTYIWVGGKDDLKRASLKISKLIPNAQFELMPGYVHNITIQARDTLPPKIEKFLYY